MKTKAMTQQEKFNIVMNNDVLMDLYNKEIAAQKVKYGYLGGGHKIGSKKVGIQKLILKQKFIAACIYDTNKSINQPLYK